VAVSIERTPGRHTRGQAGYTWLISKGLSPRRFTARPPFRNVNTEVKFSLYGLPDTGQSVFSLMIRFSTGCLLFPKRFCSSGDCPGNPAEIAMRKVFSTRKPRSFRTGKVLFSGTMPFLLFLFSSCAHTTVPEASLSVSAIPETFSIYEGTAPAPDRWWETFGSSELDNLINAALEGSLSLKTSLARLKQARALAIQAGADRLPKNGPPCSTWKRPGKTFTPLP
jgi:hypothetical protein